MDKHAHIQLIKVCVALFPIGEYSLFYYFCSMASSNKSHQGVPNLVVFHSQDTTCLLV